MIADFQTLSIKKELSKDNVTSIRGNNVQVTALQSMMEPQLLVLQKWACFYGHLLMEARSNADDFAFQIRKLHDDDVKNKNSTMVTTKFRVQFRKGTEEEFPEESDFILETFVANKDEHKISIGNCTGITQMLHYEKELNELSRLFLYFYLKTAHLMSLVQLAKIVGGNISDATMDIMQHCASAIAEQNLSRLLMEVHKTKKHDIFKHLKRSKCEVLTILRKHKHKNRTIEEFIKEICNFQCF